MKEPQLDQAVTVVDRSLLILVLTDIVQDRGKTGGRIRDQHG